MDGCKPEISPLFISQFEVDASSPFERHLNRLEVEIGREDYSQLKRVDLLAVPPSEASFSTMVEMTELLLKSTQNGYNRDLLVRLGARIYLEPSSYKVYYRLADRCLCFVPTWRNNILELFFQSCPDQSTGWVTCRNALPGFDCRYLHDTAGGVLILRHQDRSVMRQRPLLTSSHGPYDPHTLEVALYFLRTGAGGAAVINLGFAGREPLADECRKALTEWGVPLNPSNIDVIYPYIDEYGHPYCYKLEEGLSRYLELLEFDRPKLVVDVHGCVGTSPEDQSIIVGMGGLPPFHQPADFGEYTENEEVLHLFPNDTVKVGLKMIRELSPRVYLQFSSAAHSG